MTREGTRGKCLSHIFPLGMHSSVALCRDDEKSLGGGAGKDRGNLQNNLASRPTIPLSLSPRLAGYLANNISVINKHCLQCDHRRSSQEVLFHHFPPPTTPISACLIKDRGKA